MRSELDNALAALKLFSKDETAAPRSHQDAGAATATKPKLPLIEKAYAAETVPALKDQLDLMRAAILLGSSDKAKRLEAADAAVGQQQPGHQDRADRAPGHRRPMPT